MVGDRGGMAGMGDRGHGDPVLSPFDGSSSFGGPGDHTLHSGPHEFALTPTNHDGSTPAVPAAVPVGVPAAIQAAPPVADPRVLISIVERFAAASPRSNPPARSPGGDSGVATASVAPADAPIVSAPEGNAASPPASAATDRGRDVQVEAEVPATAAIIAQTAAPLALPPGWSSSGSPQGRPVEPVPDAPVHAPSGGAIAPGAGEGETAVVVRGQSPAEIPAPRGADVISDFVPAEGEPLDAPLAGLFARLEGLGVPAEAASEGASHVVPIATAIAALELARRWRNRRVTSPAIRSWRSRSTMLRGFFG